MNNKVCITFAGAIGSSKTPIAYYLSWNLGLPILSNDSIRTEVTEDQDGFSQEEYLRRRDERSTALIESGRSFIYDASVDRYWGDRKQLLIDAGYKSFIISLDLSKDKLQKMHKSKGYTLDDIDKYIDDHERFLQSYPNDVNLHISDSDFDDRLSMSLEAVNGWLQA